MKRTTLVIEDEVNIKFLNLDVATRNKIYKKLEYFVPYARHLPSYKLGRWNGMISFATRGAKTSLNLLDRILPVVEEAGYEIELDDRRAPIDLTFPEVSADMFSHIKWPEGHPAAGQPIILRDYQVEAIKAYLENPQCLQEIATGAGKCQPYNSKVLTDAGWKTMGDIKQGNVVITPDGKKSKVLATFEPGDKDVYEITFADGRTARCCEDHIWKVHNIQWRSNTKKGGPWRHLTTKELIELKKRTKRSVGVPLPSMENNTTDIDLPLDPWLLGFLLGDGTFRNSIGFSTADKELVDKVASKLLPNFMVKYKDGYDYGIVFRTKEEKNKAKSQYLKLCKRNTLGHLILDKPGSFHYYNKILMDLGLFNKHSDSKFIPEEYFSSSVNQRMELIRGLVDGDGTIDKSSIKFSTVSKQLALDFQRLVRSVGGIAKLSKKTNCTYVYNNVRKPCKDSYTVATKFPKPWKLVSLKRKQDQTKYHYQYGNTLKLNITDIKKVSNEPVKCIYIDDPNHLYLTNDYVVTHNTLITACLSKLTEPYGRSVVIVPNRDLVTQTEADYKNLGLDVGVFYGGRKEYNKTHTICTWQSLNFLDKQTKDKKKDNTALSDEEIYDFVNGVSTIIVDEVHGAKADVLKRLLMGTFAHCPIRWGLTGTVPKEEWEFLNILSGIGPVVDKLSAKELQDKDVLANCHVDVLQLQEVVEFKQYHDEYKFLLTDKARIKFISDMITGISEDGNTLVLVQQIKAGEMLTENIPGAVFINGSVKSDTRKEEYSSVNTEDNKVIVATYGVAAVGINIPRIFNLVLIEPGKSFVRTIQSIGRGLRRAQDKDFVQIWDFCGSTKYSKKHLTERKKFYKHAEYPFRVQKVKYL